MQLGHRITILGNAGSGKSTLANYIGNQLDLPVYHLDRFFWTTNWVERDSIEFLNIVEEIIKEDQWIMDGNYMKASFDERLALSSTIIFFDYNRVLLEYRIVKRYFKYKHKKREDICTGCGEKIDFSFIKWVWSFNRRVRQMILEKLAEYRKKGITVYIFKKRKDYKKFIKLFEETYEKSNCNRQHEC